MIYWLAVWLSGNALASINDSMWTGKPIRSRHSVTLNIFERYDVQTYVGGLGRLSGNALASINAVALRQTRLVLGWVTVCGRVNHPGM